MVLLTAFPLRKLPQALLLLLLLPLQHPPHPRPLPLPQLLPRQPPVQPVQLPSRLPCPATFWMSRSLPVLLSRPATCILEAMKMENEIVAPQDGTVASINVNKGDTVNSGDVLVSMN